MDDTVKSGHAVDSKISAKTVSRQPENLSGSEIQSLCDVIHSKLIPELCATQNTGQDIDGVSPLGLTLAISNEDCARLKTAVVGGHAKDAVSVLNRILDAGVAVERIYLDLLAPIARDLGEKWKRDELSFLDVTAALVILQLLLHAADRRTPPAAPSAGTNKVIALARVPGDQHMFGILTVARFFERAGWQVMGGPDKEYTDGFIRSTAANACSVAGVSVGSEAKLSSAADVIAKLRAQCRATDLTIIVGGPVITQNPPLAGALGADAMAEDARRAVTVAESLV